MCSAVSDHNDLENCLLVTSFSFNQAVLCLLVVELKIAYFLILMPVVLYKMETGEPWFARCVVHLDHICLLVALSPEMEAPYDSEEEKMRLLDLYRDMHGRMHNTSRPLKLIYHVAARETLLAWV